MGKKCLSFNLTIPGATLQTRHEAPSREAWRTKQSVVLSISHGIETKATYHPQASTYLVLHIVSRASVRVNFPCTLKHLHYIWTVCGTYNISKPQILGMSQIQSHGQNLSKKCIIVPKTTRNARDPIVVHILNRRYTPHLIRCCAPTPIHININWSRSHPRLTQTKSLVIAPHGRTKPLRSSCYVRHNLMRDRVEVPPSIP